jgi:hypothetical protein
MGSYVETSEEAGKQYLDSALNKSAEGLSTVSSSLKQTVILNSLKQRS